MGIRCLAILWGSVWLASAIVSAEEANWNTLLEQAEELRNAGSYEEARALVQNVLDEAGKKEAVATMTEGLFQLALIQYFQNDFEEARATLEIGRRQANRNNLEGLEADFLSAEGVLEWKLGNLSQAVPKLKAALEIQKAAKAWINMASISNNLGIIAYSLQDYPAAVTHYRQGLEWLGDEDNKRLRASLYSNLAEVLIPMGQLEEAEEHLYKSLAIEEESNEPRGIAYTYYNLGELYAKKGDAEKSITWYRKALEIQISLEDSWGTALTRLKYATELILTGEDAEARSQLALGLESAREINALSLLRDYSKLLADVNEKDGNTGLAEYYAGLHDYFTGKIDPDDASARMDTAEGQTKARAGTGRQLLDSPLQAATILLLCLLITILVMENSRLRKRMREL